MLRTTLLFILIVGCISFILPQSTDNSSSIFGNDFFYADFDDGSSGGFTLVNGSETNKWEVGTSTSYNLSSYSLYVSYDLGASYEYQTNSASIVHAYKDIDFSTSSEDVLLTFKLRVGGEGTQDYFSTYLVPPSTDPVAGEKLNSGSIGMEQYSENDYFRGYKVKIDRDLITEPTMRVVLSWENDASGGDGTPAAIDEIRATEFNFTEGSWSSGLSLLTSRYYAGSVKMGYSLVYAGGDITGSGVPTDEVLEYDVPGNRYQNLTNLTKKVRLNTLVKFDGGLITAGGFYEGASDPTDEVYGMKLDDFNWELIGTYPKKFFYGRAAVLNRSTLYIAGGSDETNTLLNDVNYWDDNLNSFQPADPIPGDGRADGGFATNENWGVYIGGFTNSFDFPVQVDSVLVAQFDPNNPSQITWSTGTNFPGGPRARFNVYPWGSNKFIVVGGTNGDDFSTSTIFNDAWVYDVMMDSWTQLPNKSIPMCAYQGGVINFPDNVRMLLISGGITTGPTLSAATEYFVDTVTITSVDYSQEIHPAEFYLSQNYPNPFNPSTKISWHSPVSSHQTLKIYDVLGNEVAKLIDEYKPAGSYEVDFNASGLSSGVYFYRLQANNLVKTRQMILIK